MRLWSSFLKPHSHRRSSHGSTGRSTSHGWMWLFLVNFVLSGKDVCTILEKHGFSEVRQKGSHIIMQKTLPGSTITLPAVCAD
ncbi:type II toxin-antitoxin system HicA family toxin [Methanocalculus sp. MC3]